MTIAIAAKGDVAIAPRQTRPLVIAIGIPTVSRVSILGQVLPHLDAQLRKPDHVYVCAPDPADIPEHALAALSVPASAIVAERGLCSQRNRILAEAAHADIVLFLDDDFLLAAGYLQALERVFLSDPSIVMCTGRVEADGILGAGFTVAEGLAFLDGNRRDARDADEGPRPAYSAYGCNMAVRLAAVRAAGAQFDEALPLYGWLEDFDFSRQMAAQGRIVRSDATCGVHLGTKVGRSPGVRLGYSQIANPVYLLRKKTMSPRHALIQMARNVAANIVRVPQPEPWVDRRGRLKGNVRAMADLLLGRLSPGNILAMN
jgi:polysaccharide biosynthesis transport protein